MAVWWHVQPCDRFCETENTVAFSTVTKAMRQLVSLPHGFRIKPVDEMLKNKTKQGKRKGIHTDGNVNCVINPPKENIDIYFGII